MSHRTLVWVVLPALWCLTLGSAAGAIYAKHRVRANFIELERLNAERDRLEIEFGQLQLEQSASSAHAFVESVARARLKMNSPSASDVVLVREQARQ